MSDGSAGRVLLDEIERLVADEHRLSRTGLADLGDRQQLRRIEVQLDQCWERLRQRRALQDSGRDPNQVRLRPAPIVDNYQP